VSRATAGWPSILLGAAVLAAEPCSAAERVTYNMAWLPQGSQAGVVLALEQGFYAVAGLDVVVTRGYGGVRTVNEVDQDLFDFGFGDPLAVLLNRSHGGAARLIGAVNHHYTGGLCFVVERHQLRVPRDLVGLTVGGGSGSPVQTLLPIWLTANHVDPGAVRLLRLDPAVVGASLLQGQIDAAECWRGSDKAVIEQLARRAGLNIDWLEYRRFGPDLYGSGIVTTDRLLRARPAVARAFLQATFRGYMLARANPALAVQAILKRFPTSDSEVIEQQVRETVRELPTGDAAPDIARFDPERMQLTRDYYARAFQLTTVPAAADLYTNTLSASLFPQTAK
jgi:NitT/TauT family transport system substrate-binding protein